MRRIAIANLPRLLREMLERTILAEVDMELVGEVGELGGMFRLLRSTDADVVIVGCDPSEAEEASSRLAAEAPRARILAITDNGRESLLFELCPRRVELGNLAPNELLDVIRKDACQQHTPRRDRNVRDLVSPLHSPTKEPFQCRRP